MQNNSMENGLVSGTNVDRPDYEKEIIAVMKSNASPKVFKDQIMDYHENDIAAALEYMTVTERRRLYRVLEVKDLADIFEYVEEDQIVKYLEEMDAGKKAEMVSGMDADKAVQLLRMLDKSERELLLRFMDKDAKRDVALIDSFDEDQIGSRMTTNFVFIHNNLSIKQAMKELIAQAAENDNITTLYVVDEHEIFYGAIKLNDLIIAREGESLEDLIVTSYPYVYAKEDIDDCIEWIKDYSEDSIPALAEDNKILGVITSQDFVKVVDDEMGEDYVKLAGLTAEEDLTEPLMDSIKKRLPWLLVLLGLGLVVSTVVGMFETVVSELTIVICFQSLILDMSGNVGTQSLAVTIRVLMDESLTVKEKAGLIWKECRVGFVNGLILGSLSFLFIGLYIHFFKGQTWMFSYSVSLCIGAALLLAMVISSLVGTIIPMFFHKIHVDPAVASGPLITTINDLVAVITYYGLAWVFLLEMLHF